MPPINDVVENVFPIWNPNTNAFGIDFICTEGFEMSHIYFGK